MKLSARNVVKGKVTKVTAWRGQLGSGVGARGGVEIVSIITRQSAETLGLAEGSEAWAVIKASNVMIAVD